MSIRRSLCALAVLAPCVLVPAAHAKPMLTPLRSALAQTQIMVVARYRGPAAGRKTFQATHFWLDVEKTLINKTGAVPKTGRWKVARGDGAPSVALGERVVALVDAQGRWRYVAKAMRGAKGGLALERGALRIMGFYDFNAHLVSPGVVTLAGLKALKSGKAMPIHVSGPLKVLDPKKGGPVDSGITLHVDGSWNLGRGYRVKVRGLPKGTRGLPEPKVYLSSWDGSLLIDYRRSWPRPLRISGALGAVGSKGKRLSAIFRVTMPDLVTRPLLMRYLKRKSAAHLLWRYRFRLADGTLWRASDGHDYSGNFRVTTPKGRFGYSAFYFAKHDNKREVKLKTGGKPLVIRFDRQKVKSLLDSRGTLRQLHQELVLGPIGCEVVSGAKRQRCTFSLHKVQLRPAIRAR